MQNPEHVCTLLSILTVCIVHICTNKSLNSDQKTPCHDYSKTLNCAKLILNIKSLISSRQTNIFCNALGSNLTLPIM